MAEGLLAYLDTYSGNGDILQLINLALEITLSRVKTSIQTGKIVVKAHSNSLKTVTNLLRKAKQATNNIQCSLTEQTDPLLRSTRQADLQLLQHQIARSSSFVRSMQMRKKLEYESVYARIQREIKQNISTSMETESRKQAEMKRRLQDFHDAELAKLKAKIATHKSLTPTPRTALQGQSMLKQTPEPAVPLAKERLSLKDLKRHETTYLRLKRTKDTLRDQVLTERIVEFREMGADLTPVNGPKERKRANKLKLLQERRETYSQIVRNMFVPAVDLRLKAERESLISSMSTPKWRKTEEEMPITKPPVPTAPTRGRKLEPVDAKPAEVRKYRDYLSEMRKNRQILPLSDLEMSDIPLSLDSQRGEAGRREWICAEANRLISLASQREEVIRRVPLTHPLAFEARERLSQTLVTAVKAKLSILQEETAAISPKRDF
jgi:hypothetical protein